jgi:hypothetical protein
MAAGRPKEGIESLPENWYIQVIDLYKEGASDVEIKALIYEKRGSFSNDLWDRWIAEIPEFSEVITKGRLLSDGQKKFFNSNHQQKLAKRREKRNHFLEYKNNNIAMSQRNLLSYHLRKKGVSKSKKTFELFGYTPLQLIENISGKLKDGMTLDNYGMWHIDHIKPLSLFDLSNEVEIKKAWSFENIQPLWANENIRKSNKYGSA